MRTFLHSFTGTIAAIVLIVLVVGVVGSCVAGKKSKIEDHSYLVVELYGELPEYDPPGDIMSKILGQDGETLQRVLGNLHKARVDDRLDGVILKVDAGSSLGRAKAEEIRLAVRRLQEAGKKVPCYAQSFSETQYYLLAVCDEIISPPTAFITFDGFARGSVHIKQALEKLGIKADISKIKDYKSAAELITRENMSEPARENIEWMLDEFWNSFTETLAQDRNLSEEQIIQLMERATFRAHEALERGLIDSMAYWDEVEARLKGEDDEELRTVSQKRYAKVEPSDLDLEGDRTIAVVHAQGMIGGRKSGVHPLFGITMGHECVIAELRRARDDEDVAVVGGEMGSDDGVVR